jgi:anti-anti-sigma factor
MQNPVMDSPSGLELCFSVQEDATVVQCRGSLTYENSDFLKREIKSRIPDKGRMVMDLSEVTRMDSSGLGAIVAVYLSARSRSCELSLINLNKQIRSLLAMSNLLSVFETFGRQGMRMP